MTCPNCQDTGHVCEDHPDTPWGGLTGADHCGGAGMPCPTCCDPIPQDGSTSILAAFTPRHLRTANPPSSASVAPQPEETE